MLRAVVVVGALWGIVLSASMATRAVAADAPGGWRAGAARVVITPDELMWMSGYGGRTNPAEGKLHDLWAKALVVADPDNNRLLMITTDLVGIDRDLGLSVRRAICEQHGLELAQVAINTSHTHCGPVVGRNLQPMYFLTEQQWDQVHRYTDQLHEKLVNLATAALADLEPVELRAGQGRSTLAVNRRNNSQLKVPELRAAGELVGPSDHDVPVLAAYKKSGELKAVAFGYACHATTLGFYQWCGDYPGFAQILLEQNHPGAVALFWAGCGADQNPLPRRTVELAQEYGHRLTDVVETVLARGTTPVPASAGAGYREIDLPLAPLPTREELESQTRNGNKYEASRARMLLAQIDAGKPLSPTYPYPVQVWRLGDKLTWVTLGGEVVVDYALRLKAELGAEQTWVAGYTNDVMAYIPSRRVLGEGGYEGGGSMVYYGMPAWWAPEVEEAIVSEVHRQAASLGKP